jgi:hypothetical protein
LFEPLLEAVVGGFELDSVVVGAADVWVVLF